jgi:hypothetical protein
VSAHRLIIEEGDIRFECVDVAKCPHVWEERYDWPDVECDCGIMTRDYQFEHRTDCAIKSPCNCTSDDGKQCEACATGDHDACDEGWDIPELGPSCRCRELVDQCFIQHMRDALSEDIVSTDGDIIVNVECDSADDPIKITGIVVQLPETTLDALAH